VSPWEEVPSYLQDEALPELPEGGVVEPLPAAGSGVPAGGVPAYAEAEPVRQGNTAS
jgi:hypothetical protein